MSTSCPGCGVAVLAGYVRCPRCGAAMPGAPKRPLGATAAGGTTVERRGVPTRLIAIGVGIAGVVVAGFALVGGGSGERSPETATTVEDTGEEPAAEGRLRAAPARAPVEVTPSAPSGTADPSIPVRDLRKALTRERLWGTVEVTGSRVDVRSGGCEDPGMGPVLDLAMSPLREAGLTKLRCLEQSGRVVFERDL